MHRFIRKISILILFPILLHAKKEEIQFERLSLQDGLSLGTAIACFQLLLSESESNPALKVTPFKTLIVESNNIRAISA